jgi:DNA (cytosine-5)-methyltransferase 1
MSDTSTRSGMLWEVERILSECKELDTLPQILLMENVPQVHGEGNVEDFNKWKLRLEELGYKNYFQDLIATDYGIPQTRNRCFMVSILGDYNYVFPKPIPLKLKLKDLLEDNVDEKYYLSDKMINYVLNRTPLGEKDNYAGNIIGNDAIKNAGTLTTKGSNSGTSCRASDNFIVDNMAQQDIDEKIYLKVKNATKKGYLEAENGDGVDISSRMEYHRGTVQKGKTQTLTTSGGENNGVVSSDLRIRKLSPRECWRLMGVKDEDFEKCAKNQSDSSLYHLAGDSIVTNCLCYIFNELLKKEGE